MVGPTILRKKQGQSVPAKRSTEPREVAELAHYPAFPVTDFATGATFALDGALQTNQRQGL